jgi:hypothetical protein
VSELGLSRIRGVIGLGSTHKNERDERDMRNKGG